MGHTVKRCPKPPKAEADAGGFDAVGGEGGFDAAANGFDTSGAGDGFGAPASGFDNTGYDTGIAVGGGGGRW